MDWHVIVALINGASLIPINKHSLNLSSGARAFTDSTSHPKGSLLQVAAQCGDTTQLTAALQSAAAMTHACSSSALAGSTWTRMSQALLQTSSQVSLMLLLSGHRTLTWAHTAVQSTVEPELPPLPMLPPRPTLPPFD